ncbi:MAG: adenine deaminase [Cenarchaeum symbiont of Oopsacas minuta]|nr:adenine deaminase [Cenarchaeum symbiont of Oopsacas minuta]
MVELSKSINILNDVAMGRRKADLVLVGCSLVSVYTGEVVPNTQVAVIKDRIAYVGSDASHTVGTRTITIDLRGKYLIPGFADPHTHIDQFVLPSELVKKSLLHGTTTLFADSIDIVSIAGHEGFSAFQKMTKCMPLRIFHTVPGGLPVDPKFSTVRSLTESQERLALQNPETVGLGEVFSWTKVTNQDRPTMHKLSRMLKDNHIINGHTAGASDKKLAAYVASGIISCHEPTNFEQTVERLRLGMWVMIREGSIRRDLEDIVRGALLENTYTDRMMFCTDGLDPTDIQKFGHIDYCVQRSIEIGMDPIQAITIASRNCFDYYGMSKDLGGIAPGRLADMLVLESLERPNNIDKVFVGGTMVVSKGNIVPHIKKSIVPTWLRRSINITKLCAKDFTIKSRLNTVSANAIHMETEIVTRGKTVQLDVQNGNVHASIDDDIWKVAAFDRTGLSKKHTVGFLENFGAEIGAFASTWSFHENNLIVLGTNDKDMALAANEACSSGGGISIVYDGKTLAKMQLQVGGIISSDSFDVVAENFASIGNTLLDAGCRFSKPHLVPLFLPFLAIPSIRITAGGIVDIKKHTYVKPLQSTKQPDI